MERAEGGERREGGREEGGDLVPFYLRRARRLVTFTRGKGKKEVDEERATGEKEKEKDQIRRSEVVN